MRAAKELFGIAMAMGLSDNPTFKNEPTLPFSFGKSKPKFKGRNVMRGYYARNSHALTMMIADKNLAKIANGKTGFKGFRTKRKFIPETGMSIWANA